MVNPILVALDVASAAEAMKLARSLRGLVGGYKVGLELIMSEGPGVIDQVVSVGLPVFADVKLHDIPNTVSQAAYRISKRGARWVTVHATGGEEMVQAAVDGLARGADDDAGVLAVTVLTSLSSSSLPELGFSSGLDEVVSSLTRVASSAGAEGVVCSPREVALVKTTQPKMLAVTPGIRPAGFGPDDQSRVTSPRDALKSGADLLVIGRPITRASDPAAAVAAIAESLETSG